MELCRQDAEVSAFRRWFSHQRAPPIEPRHSQPFSSRQSRGGASRAIRHSLTLFVEQNLA
ncbi:hypothetical protein E2C01_041326 [Portunus trituberculatus]|uniref:Uncharacterized protein n=1 Tax=Portunus trituberculatus TaxID=210409 RepID=A0A5B7FQF6_PORTR|nr:hypothetical protein [Portunus trituberculatus]